MHGLEDLKVSELMEAPGKWDTNFIQQIFSPVEAHHISSLILSHHSIEDVPIWHYSHS